MLSDIYVQRKRHPRDWKYLGRVRVQLKDQETGAPLKSEIATRTSLVLQLLDFDVTTRPD